MKECYGIPYAMAVHDIERVEETTWLSDYDGNIGMNTRRNQGWVLLAIKQVGNEEGYDALYVLGVPRPKFCTGSDRRRKAGHPVSLRKEWNHQGKEWECRWCLEERAHEANITGEHWL